jgi:uncharacterized protein YndB with AHSA1/START domain
MTVTGVHRDPEALTMTITTEFDAPVTRVWKLWENPRELERWWGPPEYPATFVRHDLTPGAFVTYYMTGPDGERPHGWWRVISAEPPHVLEFEDGFADDAGEPNPEMPTMTMRVTIAERPGGGSRMAIETRFPSPEAMEQLLAMGMDEGMTAAIGQIDGLLRAGTAA